MNKENKIITEIIEKCFYPSPAEQAAHVLHNIGIKSNRLFHEGGKGLNLDDAVRVAVANAIKDIEVKEKNNA